MRKLLLTVCFVFTLCTISLAAEMRSIVWDPNTETDLAGYRLYKRSGGVYMIGKGNEIAEIPAGTETYPVEGLQNGKYVVTAFDTSGNESGMSNELSLVPPSAPVNVRVSITLVLP